MYLTEDKRLFFRESTIRFRDLRNFNPIQPIFDNGCFFCSKTDFIYKKHKHELYEMIIPEDENYTCFLNGARVQVPSGCLLLLQPGDIHQDILKKGEHFFVITFSIEINESLCDKTTIFQKRSPNNARIINYMEINYAADIFDVFYKMSKVDFSRSYYVLNGLFQSFFWRIISGFPDNVLNPSFLKNSLQENFKDNLMVIFNSYAFSKISVKDMARKMKLSPRSFDRKCHEIIGQSPRAAFMDYKLNQIKKYVRHSELTINEISELFGFENQFHFSRLFKKHFGKSPMQFRIYKKEWP